MDRREFRGGHSPEMAEASLAIRRRACRECRCYIEVGNVVGSDHGELVHLRCVPEHGRNTDGVRWCNVVSRAAPDIETSRYGADVDPQRGARWIGAWRLE